MCKQRLSNVLDGILVLVKNALLDQLFRTWPVLEALLQVISPHVHFQFLLVALEGRRCCRVGQNVAVDELGSLGTGVEAALEVVCCALSLEFEGFGLEGTVE